MVTISLLNSRRYQMTTKRDGGDRRLGYTTTPLLGFNTTISIDKSCRMFHFGFTPIHHFRCNGRLCLSLLIIVDRSEELDISSVLRPDFPEQTLQELFTKSAPQSHCPVVRVDGEYRTWEHTLSPKFPTALLPPILLFLQPVRLFFRLPPYLPRLLRFPRFLKLFLINDLRRPLHGLQLQCSPPLTKLIHPKRGQAERSGRPIAGFWNRGYRTHQ